MKPVRALAVLIILAAALSAGIFVWAVRVPFTQSVSGEPKQPLFEITDGHRVSQTLKLRSDGLSGVDVTIGTFARSNSAILEMTLARADDPEAVLVQHQINTAQLADNAPHHLHFPPIDGSGETEFILTLTSPDGTPGNAVTVWFLPADAYPQGSLITDGTQQPGDLVLGLHFRPRAVDYLRANPSHLLKMRGPEDAWKLALLYAVALATAALAVGMMVRLVRREGGDSPADFPLSLAGVAVLFLLIGLWVASSRL